MSRARITPSSTIRLVEAISKVMAAAKLAPLRKSDRARATAAYEQDEDAMPKPVARTRVRGLSSPRSLTTVLRLTTAWMIAERTNPKIRAQRISQVIDPEMARA